MRNKTEWLLGVVFSAALLCSATLSAQEIKIGYIEAQRILSESAPAKAASEKLQQEFSKRKKDLDAIEAGLKSASEKYEKDAPVMADTERQRRQRELAEMDRDLQRKQREFNEDLNHRQNEERVAVLTRARRVIAEIAEKEKYDVILVDEAVAHASKRVDITDKVISALNSSK
ncbi:MAG: OmpH family outer membrane protein [Burkholderiaceae bacterium]|nr:MAG: OmpH family outer membrane protein [Burkholderiaceae bacterium]